MQSLVHALADLLSALLRLYQFVLLAAVLVQWVGADPANPIVRLLRSLTEWLFAWLRRRLPFLASAGMDLSPLAAYLLTVFLIRFVVGALYRQPWGS